MVLGVCRRLLTDPNDVDDAFQATFLVLVKKAKGIHRADLLGNWLYGVAYRVAMRVRTNAARRRLRESPGAEEIALEPAHSDGDRIELRAVLDEELSRLPATFRAPLILCYLQGQTHEEAARRLNCPVGTVRSRMARGRERLRVRLIRRGLAPSVALLGSSLTAEAAPAVVAQGLIDRTITAAIGFAAGRATAAGLVSAGVVTLTRGVSTAMTLSKLKGIAAIVLILGASAGGAGVVARQVGGASAKNEAEVDRLHAELAKARARVKMLEAGEIDCSERVRVLSRQLETATGQLEAAKAALKPLNKPSVGTGPDAVKPRMPAQEMAAGEGMAGQADKPPMMMEPYPTGRLVQGDGEKTFKRAGSGVESLASDSIIVTVSPEGDRVSILNLETGEPPASYQAEKGTKFGSVPTSKEFVALGGKGPKITRIAVFEARTWQWYPLDLWEPISGEIVPMVSNNMVVYNAGRHVYAFSAPARRWDVLELEQGAKVDPLVHNQTTTVEHAGRRYFFLAKTGRWVEIDTKTGRTIPINPKPTAKDDQPRDDAP
jgi:RNA polymerase sigma factor (sigma-70 family)